MARFDGGIMDSDDAGNDDNDSGGGHDGTAPRTARSPLVDDADTLRYLDGLMRETYQLWDQEWVGFSWRNYTYDHVRRVRNLALSLAAEEGEMVDTRVLDVAAVLHDITKAYDGEALMRDGQRMVDERGYWRNAVLPPARANDITRLYDALRLSGSVHNISGAQVAEALLDERGYPPAFRAHVGEVIVSHLIVTPETSLEGRCLYDADTIDANIGLPALYRNIQISLHSLETQIHAQDTTVDAYLAAHLHDLLRAYVADRWPAWIAGKGRDFVPRLTTAAGRRRARARLERLEGALVVMQAEVERGDPETAMGYLAPIIHFIGNRRNPSLSEELTVLERHWPASAARPAAHLIELLRRECEGMR